MKLEAITSGSRLAGIEPGQVATVVAIVPLEEGSVQLAWRDVSSLQTRFC
jgi:hypothetical protein